MVDVKNIIFNREDRLAAYLEDAVQEISNYFSKQRLHIGNYLDVIKKSARWTVEGLDKDLEMWERQFLRASSEQNVNEAIIDITKRSFKKCTSKDEINKLRGCILEAVLLGLFGGYEILQDSKYGWGASVAIEEETNKIVYTCPHPNGNECKNRMTVDFGVWNGRSGQFYECKATPEGIGCKEVEYMKHLKEELKNHSISNEMFFVCPTPITFIEMELEKYDLSPTYGKFGKEDFLRISASL